MSFANELKRRNVFKVAVLYLVASWLLLQVAELLLDALGVPGEWLRFIIVLVVLGFPLALIFSWVFEVTPEGIKREKDVDRTRSIAGQTGQRINILIVVLLVLAIAAVAVDRLLPEAPTEAVVADDSASELQQAPATDAGPPPQSIAVLPFADLSPASDQEYFSDGIAEEILNVLVRVEGLRVASRTTSWGFKGQEALGIPTIAEKLKVRHILEGSVRKAGDTVRITAQLIDADSDQHLWSQTYDRQLTAESIFEIQDEIARAIVDELGIIIDTGTEVTETLTRRADTQNLDAYELYLEGRKLFIERSTLDRAIEILEQAVLLDPEFARAWAALAAVYAVVPDWWGYGYATEGAYARANDAANRAIELDPSLALPYAVLASRATRMQPVDYVGAVSLYDQAHEHDPKETTVLLWRGITWTELGFFDRAVRDLEACLAIDPGYQNCRAHLAQAHLFDGNLELAFDINRETQLAGFVGQNLLFFYYMIAAGQHDVVLHAISHWNDASDTPRAAEFEYRALTEPDFDYEAERTLIEAAYIPVGSETPAWSSDYDDFNLLYRRYADMHSSYNSFWWFQYPESFRNSPHRKRLIVELNIDDYWREHGFPPRCRPIGDDDFECD